jgi:alkanesulfonate monooxygenase SsuD/methylene tetrahydromethanopterin reductase-like flavin-dependent oxidoreductase (luciferase family)
VAAQMNAFIERTGADELMITSQIFEHAERLRSYEITADIRRGA